MYKIVSNNSFVWLQTRLDVQVEHEGPSRAACTDIVKRGVRQQRYHLKRRYFDSSLTREQLLAKQPPPKMKKAEWTKLVDYWCDPKNQVHALHHLFSLICNFNYVRVNENFVLHLWCRRKVKRIKQTEGKCSFTKGLDLGPILPIDTAWYENYIFCAINFKDGTFVP